jgi:hypothetical protein
MKNTMTLQKQVLERIRTQGVKPTPKRYFVARDLALWTLLGVFVAALSIGFGMIIFMVKGADFGLFNKLGLTTSQKIVYSIPFFWIAATIAVAAIAFVNFKNTRRGYRTSVRQFAFIAALVAAALGSIVYSLNIAGYLDRTASQNIPFYNAVIPLNTNTWLDPEHGLLSGVVRDRNTNSDFMLRDANAELWHVTGTDIIMPKDFKFQSGDRVKIIGTLLGSGEFRALEIHPWEEERVVEE